ncbi:MAG: tripartite tricarboxylate transporter substrate binding protein [Candidatus Protistobacter heckmanni]|nr:tripartite tricarboxylate transporter substrate binding protein [Candidatus Protistobacter heckmanni]
MRRQERQSAAPRGFARRLALAALTLAALFAAAPASAQGGYPMRPVTLLVGFAPSGGTDLIARAIGPKLGELLGQSIVIENRPGASGMIAAAAGARAASDGYTLLMGHVSANAMVPAIVRNLNYDPVKDFTPIGLIGHVPQVVVVPADSPAKTLAEFITMLKARPGKYSYASSGVGTQQHFAAELFKQATGTDMLHVPFKGSGAAITDLISGRVDVNFDTVPSVLQQIKSGKLRALAVTTATRVAVLPNVPTVIESGVPGYDISTWYMLLGPKNLPPEIAAKLNEALNRLLKLPDVRDKLEGYGTDVGGGTQARAAELLGSEVRRWKAVAAKSNIVAE